MVYDALKQLPHYAVIIMFDSDFLLQGFWNKGYFIWVFIFSCALHRARAYNFIINGVIFSMVYVYTAVLLFS